LSKEIPFLTRLPGVIAAVHPLVYILIYLLLIPVFACLYYLMPAGSFYAPYAHLEPTTTSDLSRIGNIISGALHRSVGTKDIEVEGWKLIRFGIFGSRSADGSLVTFNILGTFEKPDATVGGGGKTQPMGILLPCQLPAIGSILIGPRPDNTADIMRPILLDVSTYPPDFQKVQTEFFNKIFEMPYPPTGGGLILTREEDSELAQLLNGLQGDPIALSNALPRMLYFSAIVTTTVGFGDIVPMTTMARLFVAIQAVLGISVAGLFLTAIAFRASHRTIG
jgi:hypothetical protein